MRPNQKNADSALEIDRLALQLAKDPHSKAFLPLAEEYCKAGMWKEATGVLEDGLKRYPGFITAMVVLGRAYDQLGQPVKAKAVLEEAIKVSPENLRAHRTLVKIYASQGQTGAALKSCAVILALNPRDEEALSIQARLGMPAKEGPVPRSKDVQAPSVEQPVHASPSVEPTPERGTPVGLQDREDLSGSASDETGETSSPLGRAGSIIQSALQADGGKPAGQSATGSPETEATPPPSKPSPHAETIAQLESWLRAIGQNRRKDATSTGAASSTS
ncbi:hypothetical protein W02_06610 [Nitrospira sp. KM1]|uniref:tetratricopeptide repeat protein n=1 Tax=Nitrospira sp. KM1 TaxID=1936990 RepID=UPI0013A7599C|nr:tetratricopeptide repeat protein [Nitrospira sp. KM1]BCA53521.1 hypothetical protein W02_06610 [Nitrospira sp. KM1]